MKHLFALLLALAFGIAQAQQAEFKPFQLNGNTVTFTAAGTCPTPVQATTPTGWNTQYVITNIGANTAFVSFGTSAIATTNCVIPTSTSRPVIPVLPLTQVTITTGANSFFTGITAASTSVIYVTPGTGQ